MNTRAPLPTPSFCNVIRGFIFIESTHPRWFLATLNGRIASRHDGLCSGVADGPRLQAWFPSNPLVVACGWKRLRLVHSFFFLKKKPSPFASVRVCLDGAHRFKMAWSQNGRSNLQTTEALVWFPPSPHSHNKWTLPPSREATVLGLVNELSGATETSMEATLLQMATPPCARGSCPEILLWRCKWLQNNGHCWVARWEVIQGGVMLNVRVGCHCHDWNPATVTGVY